MTADFRASSSRVSLGLGDVSLPRCLQSEGEKTEPIPKILGIYFVFLVKSCEFPLTASLEMGKIQSDPP